MTRGLSDIKAVIWDIDGVFYQYTPALYQYFADTMAHAAISLGVKMAFEQAREAAINSFITLSHGSEIFVREHGIDREKINDLYHDTLDVDFLEEDVSLKKYFAASGLRHIALTHATTRWGERILKRSGAFDGFECVIGTEVVGFVKKDQCEEPHLYALDYLNLEPHQVIFKEDTVRNLAIPHKMGMHTSFINNDSPLLEIPEHVHRQFTNVHEAVKFLRTEVEPQAVVTNKQQPNPGRS